VVEYQRRHPLQPSMNYTVSQSLRCTSPLGPPQLDQIEPSSLNFGPSIVQSVADFQSAQRSEASRSSRSGGTLNLKSRQVEKSGGLSFGPSIIQSIADFRGGREREGSGLTGAVKREAGREPASPETEGAHPIQPRFCLRSNNVVV
jgi:hypothetical protein